MDEKNLQMLMKHIEDSLAEEAKDADKYITMAEMAPPEFKPILMDISHEEGIHQMHLANMHHELQKRMAHSGTTPEK